MDFDTDRQRGMLSRADRAYLLGEAEMAHEQSKRNAEARIRERVRHAVLDFNLLVHHLQTKDRRQVFEKSIEDEAFVNGLVAMLSFAYTGAEESGVDFGHLLEPAIRKAEEVHAADVLGHTVSVEVDFDVTTEAQTDIDDVAARVRDGEAVRPAELFSLLVTDATVLDGSDEVILQLRPDGDDHDQEESFVEKIARFVNAEVVDLPRNRVKLRLADLPGDTGD